MSHTLVIPQRTLNINSPSSISNCCIVSVQGEIICMVESTLSTPKCLVLSSNITSSLADNHHLIASVVVVLTPRTLPMSTQGKHFDVLCIIRSLINRLNSGIFKIFELMEWILNLNSSDCGASKIICNDTNLEPFYWVLNIENSLFSICVGVWVGGHLNFQGIGPQF